jgi:hypothetical protein
MSKGDVLLRSLLKFYDDPERLGDVSLYTSKDSPISLRLLDWLVTNYAKKNNVVYVTSRHGAPHTFNMFMDYKAQLKAYSKKYFDPFCRRDRVTIENAMGIEQQTTVAQLNFFKWALVHGVVAYALQHKEVIEVDMLAVSKLRQDDDTEDDRPKKRRELSSAAIKLCTKTLCHITVRF